MLVQDISIMDLLQEIRTFASTWTSHMAIIMGLHRDMVSLISGLIWIVLVAHITVLLMDITVLSDDLN